MDASVRSNTSPLVIMSTRENSLRPGTTAANHTAVSCPQTAESPRVTVYPGALDFDCLPATRSTPRGNVLASTVAVLPRTAKGNEMQSNARKASKAMRGDAVKVPGAANA